MHAVIPEALAPVVTAVRDAGGCPYLVGGAVRDVLLDPESARFIKDFDFEVYRLSLDALIRVLSGFGAVETVGSSFGVIKLFISRQLDLDFALPRRESKSGRGHRGFVVSADPDMPQKEACARRDFTVNALLMNPFTGEILDFFNGQRDLADRVLRHTSDHFGEDPLRPLRAVQFAARFDMRLARETVAMCRSLEAEAETLAPERVFGEWEKWARFAPLPSRGLSALQTMGWRGFFGDLLGLEAVRAPDGRCAWEHTLAAVDRAAAVAEARALDRADRLVLMLSVLCHALPDGAPGLLERLGVPSVFRPRILALVRGRAGLLDRERVTPEVVLHLSHQLKPERLRMLGRVLDCTDPRSEVAERLRRIARDRAVLDQPPEPLLTGKRLVRQGIRPGPEMGEILRAAYDAQLSCRFDTTDGASEWLERFLAEGPTRGRR